MWLSSNLSELCDVLDRRRKPITKKDRSPGIYPYYGATGILDYVEGFLFDEQLVLIGEDGAKWGAGDNSAFKIQGKTWVNNHAHVIRPKREMVLDEWLIYYLNAEDLSKFITGMTVPKLNQGKLKEIPIPLPPIPEQQRIVAILDQAFAEIEKARANAEQNLKNARELFDSYLQQVFSQRGEGWIESSVSAMAQHNLGKMLDKKKNRGALKPYLRNLSVRWFEFNLDDVLEMRFEDKEVDRYTVSKGDLLICEGGYPGRAAIWDMEEEIYYQKAIHRVRFHDAIYNKWLLYFLYLSDSTETLKTHFTGAGIQHFTGKALGALRLAFPPIKDTFVFIDHFEQLHDLVREAEKLYEEKLTALDELKKSLLQKAFSGELTKSKGMAA
jgi:type I restriction enzyme, S subunit